VRGVGPKLFRFLNAEEFGTILVRRSRHNCRAQMQSRIVAEPEKEKEIENTLDASRRISEVIERLKHERGDTEADLSQSLVRDLAAAPLNVDSAIEKHKIWKAKDGELAAKIKSAEELRLIIERHITELKNKQAEVLKAVICRKLDSRAGDRQIFEYLENEAAAEKDKAALIKAQIDKEIDSLNSLLGELEKQYHL
jgi:hypothetical protein